MAAKNTLQFFLGPLLKRFFQDMGREPNNLEMLLIKQKAGQLLKDSNKVIPFKYKRNFAEEIEAMKKSGDIVDVDDIKISDKITDREMFKNSNLNKPTIEGQMEKITGASNKIKQIQKEQADMYKPKSDAEIKAKFDKQNQESIQRFKNKMKKDEPEDMANGGRIGFSGGKGVMAILKNLLKVKQSGDDLKDFLSKRKFLKDIVGNTEKNKKARELRMLKEAMEKARENPGFEFPSGKELRTDIEKKIGPILLKDRKLNADGGRASHYTGGMVDVEPNLSDIGHGSDALMARTRLVSPGSQSTTSTGLNYLLAEDNDNIRVPFSAGGGGRRAFLKLLATLGGGIAGLKSGLFTTGGKETTKKAITETIKQSADLGQPPPYFFKLVEKIKTLGDDTLASQDKAIAKKYKDYVMEEDFAGNISIIKKDMDNPYPTEVIMSYKVDDVALKNKKGFAKAEEYEEFTARPDRDGKMKDIEPGVPDEVIEEGTMFEDNMTEFGKTKKADGGRIGFKVGGSGKKFIEKIFGKGSLDVMKAKDPELHKGMLEVVEMFRNRDKEGLKIYLQKFLPHMDDETIEAFIVGDAVDAAGQGKYGLDNIQGQLIRLGSGRDYAGKIKMIKDAENMRALDKLDVDKMKPNANGGLITMLGE
jgi:hypothetical protein